MKLFFFIFHLLPITWCHAQNCDIPLSLDSIEQSIWKSDSIGNEGKRHSVYMKNYFYKTKEFKKNNGYSMDCILNVFGHPNKIQNKHRITHYIYYVKRENEPNDENFEGLTLEIMFKENQVILFAFYIT